MPRDPAAAIAWAEDEKGSTAWRGRCESFVRQALDFASVYPSANEAWYAAGDKHPGDFDPPAGVPVFWALTGKNATYGHVALSIGGGKAISSSDERGHPVVSEISIRGFTDETAIYRGWAGFYHGVQLDYTRGKHSLAAAQIGGDDEMTPEQEGKLNDLLQKMDLTLKTLARMDERLYGVEQKANDSLQKQDHTLDVLGSVNERAYGANVHSRDAVQALNEINTTER